MQTNRVKVGNRIINLDRVIYAVKDECSDDSIVRVYLTKIEGDFFVGGEGSIGQDYLVLQEGEAGAFWRFYSSDLYGCLDVGYFAPRDPQVTQSVEISGLQEEV